jgi:hypothetical protein
VVVLEEARHGFPTDYTDNAGSFRASVPESVFVLADEDQLETLARLRFEPQATDELGLLVSARDQGKGWLQTSLRPLLERGAALQALKAQASAAEQATVAAVDAARTELRAAMHALTAKQRAGIAALTSVDDDADGLTNTEEQWWCTDPMNPNSDGDAQGYTDGQEVHALLDFTLPRNVRWGYGPPFGPPNAWPNFNDRNGTHVNVCNDGDYDTIPDFAEVFMVGTRVPAESTDGDKFDDGQELFGVTYCPGAPTNCGYGSYPAIEYWNFIQASMPNWVLPPGDNPLVAAFPVPEVYVTPGSWTVETVTTITDGQGRTIEGTHSYETSVTRGESTSIADTVTWNNWEEVSQAIETPLGQQAQASASAISPAFSTKDFVWGVGKMLGGVLVGGAGLVGGVLCETVVGCLVAGVAVPAGAELIKSGFIDAVDAFKPNDAQQGTNKYNITNVNNVSASATANASVVLNQNFDFQGVVNSLDGVQYAINRQGDLLARGLYDISYQLSRPRYTETRTNGHSWGGAQTTTHEEYEEHSISEGEAFTTGQNWSTAWAVDSSHAADLTFEFTVKNTGTEYARELTGIVVNVYIGDDTSPSISYPAWEKFPNGKLENLFPVGPNTPPGQFSTRTFTTNPIHLTLEQMKRIDLGERLTVKVESYSYGADELFYTNAVTGGVTVFIEDGVEDGDETVDSYVIPTWGVESVQEVLTRYFRCPPGQTCTDTDGNLNSLWTPEFDGANPPTWNEHYLSDIAWWNVYLTQADAGDTSLKDLPAQAGSGILFRFNRDSDRDGYNDRAEFRYYCGLSASDPDHAHCADAHLRPEIHPQPEVSAGYVAERSGNVVTVKLAVENTGTFDAYGIDAVMYSPDGTTTIGNNTVGGNGRVRPGNHVAVGSLIKAPDLVANWGNSTAKPYAGGNYAGDADRTYTFSAATPGVVGQGSTSVSWNDGTSGTGTIDLGASYHAPLPVDVANGLQMGFNTGTIDAGTSFTVEALTPRDTFTYTINSEPFTPPVIVVSYSDPQGSHRFVTPVELPGLDVNLVPHAGEMLKGLRLEIVTTGAVSTTNTTNLVVNNPHPETVRDGHLYLNFVSDGKLVLEKLYTLDIPTGPTILPAEWSIAEFSADYNPDGDNILIAFWTDSENNIIDSAARPLSSFQEDPRPAFAMSTADAAWDFGTVTQGEIPEHTFTFANTGFMDLLTYFSSPGDLSVTGAKSRKLAPGDTTTYAVTLDTRDLPTGPYNETITIRTSDPDNPTRTVHVIGNIQSLTDAAYSRRIEYRPWDRYVWIPGSHTQNEQLAFPHRIDTDPAEVEPLYVYDQGREIMLGLGAALPPGLTGGALQAVFGDGSDGDLIVGSEETVYVDNVRTAVADTAPAGQNVVSVASTAGFSVGDGVLIIQIQGGGAGNYEFGTISSLGTGTLTLTENLQYSYGRSSPSATLYERPNYSGRAETFTSDDSTLEDNYIGNDAVSSIGVSPGTVAILYEHINYGGVAETFTADDPDLSNNPIGNYRTSSIRVFSSGKAQVLRVPHYRNVTVLSGGTLTARSWDGSTGGIVAFRASGQVDVQANGTIAKNGENGKTGGGITAGGTGGFKGGDTSETFGQSGFQGESYLSAGVMRDINNGGGGGGGGGNETTAHGGGGGGYGTGGESKGAGQGGGTYGTPHLSTIFLGSGGGGGGVLCDTWGDQGSGGAGGGAVIIFARTIRVDGGIQSIGGQGGWGFVQQVAGGGGSGGSIKLVGQNLDLGTNKVAATGGAGGGAETGDWRCGGNGVQRSGGAGGAGRIRIEYQNITPGWSTNPPASTQQVNFFAIEKVDANTVRYILPESFTGGRTHWMQFGQRYAHPAAGDHVFHARLPKGRYSSATLDIILARADSSPVNLCLDMGNDGVCDWTYTGSPTIPFTTTTTNLATPLNAYLASVAPDPDGTVVVPIRVNLNTGGELFLTNLVAAPGASVDLALSAGDISFGTRSTGLREQSQLKLAGSARFTGLGTLSLTALASGEPTEGDTVPITATLHNTGSADSGPLTVAFFATPPGGFSETYIGAAFVSDVPAGGTAQASIPWNTMGFTGNVPVRVKVDPYNRVAETNENNNEATTNLTIRTRPDLHVPAISLSDDEPVTGQPVTVRVTLHNGGQTAAGASTLALYDGNPDSGGTLLGEGTPAVSGESQTTLDFTWTPTAPGPHRLFTVSDRDDAVSEFDEGNNLTWRDVYVGFQGPIALDSGNLSADPAYTTTLGYGVVDEGTADVLGNCGTSPHQTYRRDPSNRVVYRFDHLLPGHFYHLDLVLYQCGSTASRQEYVLVDGNRVAGPEDLGDGKVHRLSLRLDPALYANRTISVTVEVVSGGALVNQIALHDIDYRYADSGGTNDPEYPGTRGYGWLDGERQTPWGTLPYQSMREDQDNAELRYRFDRLDPLKRYRLHFTFYQGSGANRTQKIQVDGADTGTSLTIVSGQPYSATLPVPLTHYQSDGSIVVGIVRTDTDSLAMVNEIALEEETQVDVTSCNVSPTPSFSQAYGYITINGQPAPAGSVIAAYSPRNDLVGCYILETAGQYPFTPIYGEDLTQTPPIPGMRDGEPVTFRVNGALAVQTPLFYWHDDHMPHRVDLAAGTIQAQSILLSPGWNLFSFNVEPPVPLVDSVLYSIAGRYCRVLGENLGETQIYDCNIPERFRTLKELHGGRGYYLRLEGSTSASLLVEGVPITPTTPIGLHQGWNWAGYLPSASRPVTVALQSIAGSYRWVHNGHGQTYDPSLPQWSTLTEMRPGDGYWIFATQPVTLTYPAAAVNLTQQATASESGTCSNVSPTPYLSVVYGEVTLGGVPAPPGTRVEAITPRGEVAGCFVVDRAGQYGFMHVYGEDSGTPPLPGFRTGEPLRLRVNGLEATLVPPLAWEDDHVPHRVDLQVSLPIRLYLPFTCK